MTFNSSMAPITGLNDYVKDINLKKWLLGILFIISFQSLRKSPMKFMSPFFETLLLAFILIFIVIYVADKITGKKKFTSFEKIALSIAFLIPIYSALMSFIYWKQPIFYGLTIERHWLIIGVGIFLFYLLKIKAITIFMIRDVFLTIAWLQLAVYFLAFLIFDPSNFYTPEGGYVDCNDAKGGCTFTFDTTFLLVAALYYFIIFFRTNSVHYFLSALLFLGYIIFIYQKRGLTLSIITTLGIYFYFNLSSKKKLYYFISIVLMLVSIGLLLLFIQPEILYKFKVMYANAFDVLQGNQVNEASANSRIKQFLVAGLFWLRNPSSIIFGNGSWSYQWVDSPQFNYGWFYAADLGIIGSLFIYGIIGVLVIQFVYLKSFLWIRKIKIYAGDIFFQTCKYFLLLYWLRCITTGGTYFSPGIGITFIIISIIYFYFFLEKKSAQ